MNIQVIEIMTKWVFQALYMLLDENVSLSNFLKYALVRCTNVIGIHKKLLKHRPEQIWTFIYMVLNNLLHGVQEKIQTLVHYDRMKFYQNSILDLQSLNQQLACVS